MNKALRKSTPAAAAAAPAEVLPSPVTALQDQIAAVSAEHAAAVERRQTLQAEQRTASDQHREAEARVRVAETRGMEPDPADTAAAKRHEAKLMELNRDLQDVEALISSKSEELRELETHGAERAWTGCPVDVAISACAAIEAAEAEARAVRTEIERQEARLRDIDQGAAGAQAPGDAALSDLRAKVALGQADATALAAAEADAAARRENALRTAAEAERARADVRSTIEGLARVLEEKVAAVENQRARAEEACVQYLAAEQLEAARQYAVHAKAIIELVSRIDALSRIGRGRKSNALPLLLNENWASCFALPSIRRSDVEGVQSHPTMPGLLTTGMLLAQPRARGEAIQAELSRLRAAGAALL